ncbi:DUF2442 domain-containing protein [Methylobacterium sp. Leaf469]|uniref:DUF2442 domain-containing protein n=1 Tax=Methylobacterium sp. Leaf469 TaxID=1736387 RepID=UPI0009E6E93C|nr:DUF2442 domain-containing protein [Methylobacterium sp. Leaf469]
MSATDTITVGRALPKLASVEPANGPFSVSVTWASGSRTWRTDIVDLAPIIFTFKVFKPLRDNPELFRSVKVGEWGASLVWPGNDDLDIGAESVEEMAEEVMTNSDFTAFLKRTGFTLDAAAAQLGIARRLVAYYAKDREIPRYIALACRQLEAGALEKPGATPTVDSYLNVVPGGGLPGAPYGWVGGAADQNRVFFGAAEYGPPSDPPYGVWTSRAQHLAQRPGLEPKPMKKADPPVHHAGGVMVFAVDPATGRVT